MGSEPTNEGADPDLTERPAGDELARKVARSKIAGKLFAKHEPVKLGRYHLLEQVGAGGMGIVWGAWDPELDRRVAIKLVKTELARARERIVREGQALAKLSHPNVVPIYDVGVVDDQVYLVMEWVRGENLRTWAEKPRTPREVAAVYRAAAQGLAAAHAAGLIHRDFKPENAILGDDGRVRVLDFGLALDRSEASDGARAGTPKFMAPEQLEGEPVAASDQFAVGVSLGEALGKTPPRWLVEIIERATAPAADARYPAMDDLVAALGRDPAVVWRRRIFVAAALGLAGGAFAIGTLRGGDVERCTGGAGEISSVWNPGVREGLAAHLRTLGPYGVEVANSLLRELDEYAQSWAVAHRDACRAHDRAELTAELYASTLGCLARSRGALATAAEILGAATVGRLPDGVVAARALPMADACRTESESSTVSPPARAIAGRVSEVANLVVRGRLLALAADPRAIETTQRAVIEAESLGYSALSGRALLVQGFAFLMQQRRASAVVAFERSMAAALEASDGATAVEAIARKQFALSSSFSADGAPLAEAQATMRIAEPLALGLRPGGGFARALLFNNAGTVALALQDRTTARRWFEKALAERPAETSDGVELASIVGNLGLVAIDASHRDAMFAKEGDELAHALGADHPLALDARIRAAMFVEPPGRVRSLLRDACTRYRQLHPHLVERAAQCAYELAWLAEEQGDVADAQTQLETIDRKPVEARVAEGFRLLLAKKLAEADASMMVVGEKLLAESHFWPRWRGVDALLVAAIAQTGLGDRVRARSTLERALSSMTELRALRETTFYRRRLARVHAMLANLGAGEQHKRLALDWYRGIAGYEAAVATLEAVTD